MDVVSIALVNGRIVVFGDEKYESNLFITLTYDDDHVPLSTGRDPETGELFTTYTLDKRHWQLFMKRLRKWHDEVYPDRKLRFLLLENMVIKAIVLTIMRSFSI